MPTLLLKLVAPMQSWGVQSNFTHRDTGFEPSKSGVIGLICAALGRDRAEPIDDLAALKMGVRVDRQGTVLKDYHTAKDVMRAGGGIKDTELSDRFYLADAAFLVGLQGENKPALCWKKFSITSAPGMDVVSGQQGLSTQRASLDSKRERQNQT